PTARVHLEQGIACYAPLQDRSHLFLYGLDSGVTCRIFAAQALWLLGYPDQALQRMHEALTLAQKLAHPLSMVFALIVASLVCVQCQEVRLTQERAEAAIALCTEHGFGEFWLAQASVWLGWALAEQGQQEEGISHMRHGIAAFRAAGAELQRQYWLALLAEAYVKMGQPEKGGHALAEARAEADKTGEGWWEADLQRLEGELTLLCTRPSQEPSFPEAEASFHKALEVARRQQAKSLELRAATSLARLWRQQGKKDEARQMLAEIYGWFTEGFDTKDLQEAKALLEALS